MTGIISFGDIFRFREKEYVFLGIKNEIVYTALILDREKSELVQKQFNRQRNSEKIRDHPAYCFVILRTEEFRGRVAYLAKSGEDETANGDEFYFDVVGKVIRDDLIQIKNEILSGPVDLALKALVRDIEIL